MITEPWWVYPPEVNSARIIGIGPLPWIAAAGIWAAMAAEAAATQAVFQAQNAIQAGVVHGASTPELVHTSSTFGAWLAAIQAEATEAAAANAAVAQSYLGSLAAMVPLPVVVANRVAAAAAHTASAAGAVNPAGVMLDMQYAGFHLQNAGVMQAYDTPVQLATMPRVFVPPPPLVTGGAAGAATFDTVVRAAQKGAMKGVTSQNTNAAKLAAKAANTKAGLPAQSQGFLSKPGGVPAQALSAGQSAMSPVSSIMGQMAGVTNGVTGTGLGSGSSSFGNLGAAPRGGLALGGGGAGLGGGAGTGLGGGGGMGLGGTGLASAPLAASPVANGSVGNLGRIGPAFTGIDLATEKAAAGRPGGMPLGGMGGMGGRGGSGARKSAAQEVIEAVQDVSAQTERERERERTLFA